MTLRLRAILACLLILICSCSLIKFEINETDTRETTKPRNMALKLEGGGSLELALAWGQRFEPPRQYPRALVNLKDSIKKWTMLDATLVDHLRLDSTKLHEMPFVYVTTNTSFELTQQEIDNVKKYLLNGGFMVLDNAAPGTDLSQSGASLRKMIRDTLGSQGRLQTIPNDHEIYHSHFDFDGPPAGGEIASVSSKRVLFLEGVWIKDRLVLVYSDKGYVTKWHNVINAPLNDAQLKFGVNMVIFALTQPGGISSIQ